MDSRPSPARGNDERSDRTSNVELVIDSEDPLRLPTARELYEHGAGDLAEAEHEEHGEEHMEYADGIDGGEALDGDGHEALDEPRHGLEPQDLLPISMAAGGPKPKRAKKKTDKKGVTLVKTWLKIAASGDATVLQADKWKLVSKLGIQARDLRLLDPHMATTYPSAILCRDKSIVVNLEHIKAIITVDSVLVVNHEDESSAKLIEELKTRLASPQPGLAASKSFASMGDLQRAAASAGGGTGLPGGAPTGLGLSVELPFELRALEVCLDELASVYLVLTTELETTAYPSLDALAAKVTSPHLERVRRIKNRLVRLTTRVETVREVLEKFLDDDEDMHDLNLTANQEREKERLHMDLELDHAGETAPGEPRLGRLSTKSMVSSVSTNSSIVENEVAEVEMLLEAYFMHFDNTYNRLQTLNEYIKDTEDLVNIKLDQHRNQLISTDLILTALTCAMAMVTTIAGIFGMNLDSGLQEAEGVFNAVTITSSVGAVLLFVGFLVWAWRYGLLVFA